MTRRRGLGVRFTRVLLASLAAMVVLGADPAAADPPGPTDYQTRVVSIEPPADFEMGVIGATASSSSR
jgi:hypothetical protein